MSHDITQNVFGFFDVGEDFHEAIHLFFLKALLVHHIHGSDVINIGIDVVAESERDVIENGKMREKGITLENRIDRTFMRGQVLNFHPI